MVSPYYPKYPLFNPQIPERNQKGREEGKEEGKAEGITQNSRRIAARMLAKGQQPDFISEITGLPVAEIYQLKGTSKN